MKKKLCLMMVVVLCLSIAAKSQVYITEKTPHRIVLNLTPEPTKSMAVTWRTISEVDSPQVQFTVATDSANLELKATAIHAGSEKVYLDGTTVVFHHSAVMNNLIPSILYAYRVGGDSEWSEWNQFKTAKAGSAPFEFIFFGDPQNSIKDFVSRVFRKGFAMAPDARFWLFTGDLMDKPHRDDEWAEWFYAGGFMYAMVPSIMVPGSHEYFYRDKDRNKINEFTKLWNVHFTLPENGVEGLEERTYYVDYQGVRFIMLDGQSKLQGQTEWMEKVLANNPNKWTIVAVHQPFFSMGRTRDERATRDAFMALIDQFSVDLVLTGHDHVYSRSYKLKNGVKTKDKKSGTVYVISVSGSKSYPLNLHYAELMQKTGSDIQLFQVISIEKNKLSFRAYTVTGSLFDSFELDKKD
jgi:phosphodiesterase/alkaline phosphatase D-like protein